MGAYQIVRFIIYSLLDILSLMIVVRALLSFFVMMAGSELLYKVYNVLALITNPILEPVRRLLQKVRARQPGNGPMKIQPLRRTRTGPRSRTKSRPPLRQTRCPARSPKVPGRIPLSWRSRPPPALHPLQPRRRPHRLAPAR